MNTVSLEKYVVSKWKRQRFRVRKVTCTLFLYLFFHSLIIIHLFIREVGKNCLPWLTFASTLIKDKLVDIYCMSMYALLYGKAKGLSISYLQKIQLECTYVTLTKDSVNMVVPRETKAAFILFIRTPHCPSWSGDGCVRVIFVCFNSVHKISFLWLFLVSNVKIVGHWRFPE